MSNTECCNQNCNQGRDCPLRISKAQAPQARPVNELRLVLQKFCDVMQAAGNWPDTTTEREALQECAKEARAALQSEHAVQQGVQPEVDLPDVEDMAHSALEECLSGGLSHFVLHKWMRSVMTKTQKALATHPTQQGLDAQMLSELSYIHKFIHPNPDGSGITIRNANGNEWAAWVYRVSALLDAAQAKQGGEA